MPDACILFPIFQIGFGLYQVQRFGANFLVVNLVIQIFHGDENVISNQCAVFFRSTLAKALFQPCHDHFLLGLADETNFPEILETVTRGDETFILGHGEELGKIFFDTVLGVTFG